MTVSKDVKNPKTAKSGFKLTQKTVKQKFGSRKKQSAPYFYQETSIVLNQVFRTVGVFFYFAGGESNLENDKSQDQKSDKASRSDKDNNIKNTEEIKMNKYDIQRARVENIKRMYPPGTRIELISISDPYAPVPSGTKGTVLFVDDIGTIHPKWDNGRSLGVIVEEDEFRKLSQSEIEAGQQTLDEKSEQSNSSDEPDETIGMNMIT